MKKDSFGNLLGTLLLCLCLVIFVFLIFPNNPFNTAKASFDTMGTDQSNDHSSDEQSKNNDDAFANTDNFQNDNIASEEQKEIEEREKLLLQEQQRLEEEKILVEQQKLEEERLINEQLEEQKRLEELRILEEEQKRLFEEEEQRRQLEEAQKDYDKMAIDALKEDYYNNIRNNSKFSISDETQMLDELSNIIISRHLFEENNTEILYNNIVNNQGYSRNILNQAFEKLVSESINSIDKTIDYRITNLVSSDAFNIDNKTTTIEDGIIPGFIKSIDKQIRPLKSDFMGDSINNFRQFEVTAGLSVYDTKNKNYSTNLDLIILIDNSDSMSRNFDNAILSAKDVVNLLIPEGYDKNSLYASKIAVVSFSNTAKLVANFTSDRYEILKAIDSIAKPSFNSNDRNYNDIGANGTNIQEVLLASKKLFNIEDNEKNVSNVRNKSIILLSDGEVTTRRTDIWEKNSDIFESAAINNSSANIMDKGVKRWSYITNNGWNNGPVPKRVYLPDGSNFLLNQNETDYNGNTDLQKQFNEKITMYEAQLLNFQGVNVYPVSFADNIRAENFMYSLSLGFDISPDFNTDIYENVFKNSYNEKQSNGIFFKSENINSLLYELDVRFSSGKLSSLEYYEIFEKLNKEFEFISNDYVISKRPFGEEPINTSGFNNVNFKNDTLLWKSINEVENGSYYITYKVKAKDKNSLFDNGADKNIYGPNASDRVFVSSDSYVKVKALSKTFDNINFDKVDVALQPNLDISFDTSANLLLAGDVANFSAQINKGSGYFAYRIYENVNNNKSEIFKNEKFVKEPAYDITLDDIVVNYVTAGDHEYIFEVIDLVSNQTKEQKVKINVRDPKLTINIVDSKGTTNLEGAFETKITAFRNDTQNVKKFFINGLGQINFSNSGGSDYLVSGTSIKVETYVPYGYEIVSIEDTDGNSDGIVYYNLYKDNLGKLTGFEHSVTVKVKKIDQPKYFFDWTWIFGNNN